MSFDRVTVTKNILGADGRLLVEQGAIGSIVSRDAGVVGVLFDDGQHFVELSGCGQRLQRVPFIDTTPIQARKLTFYHPDGSDYLDTYNADAVIVAHILGLTLLTVHERHATSEHPAGAPHTAMPLYVQETWFAELRAHGFEPVIAA